VLKMEKSNRDGSFRRTRNLIGSSEFWRGSVIQGLGLPRLNPSRIVKNIQGMLQSFWELNGRLASRKRKSQGQGTGKNPDLRGKTTRREEKAVSSRSTESSQSRRGRPDNLKGKN